MARPRLDAKKLLLVLVGLAMLAGGTYVVHRLQSRRQAQGLRDRIDASLAAGDDVAAIDGLERYLAVRPADNGRLAQMARLLAARVLSGAADERQVAVCRDVLRAAVARMPQDMGLRESWALFLIGARDFDAALPHLESVWAELPAAAADRGPRDRIGLLLAQSALVTGNVPLAQETLESLVAGDGPAPREAYANLAMILANARREPRAADEVLARMVAARPDDAAAWTIRGEWLLRSGQIEDAVGAIERARRLAPDDADAMLLEATVAMARRDVDRAEAILAEAPLADAPLSEGLVVLRADVATARRDFDAAIEILRRGVEAFPQSRQILRQSLLVSTDTGRIDEIRALLPVAREKLGSADPAVPYGEAPVAMADRRWEAAIRSWELAREGFAGNSALVKRIELAIADCEAALGRPEAAAEARRRAMGDDSRSIEAILLEAQSLAETGRPAEALALVERVAATMPAVDVSARPAVWQPLLRLRVADVLRRPEGERDWSKVDALVGIVEGSETVSEQVREGVGIYVLGAKGRAEEVLAAAEAAVTARPDDAGAAARLLSILARSGKGAEALARAAAWPPAVRDAAEVLAEEAEIAARTPGVDAEAWLAEVERGLPALEGPRALAVRRRLMMADAMRGKLSAAERIGEEVVAAVPADLPTRRLLLDLAVERGDASAAVAQASEIERLAGVESPVARVARAAATALETVDAARQGSLAPEEIDAALEPAVRSLDMAAEERPGWPDIDRQRALVAECRGDVSDAIGHLRRAAKAGEAVPWSIRRLARLLVESRRFDEAMPVIAALGDSGGPVVERLRADVAERSGDGEGALAIAAKATPPDCRDVDQLLWHARLLARQGLFDEAVAAADRAIELAPRRVEPRSTLLKIAIDAGRGPEATAIEAAAVAALPPQQREVFELEAAALRGDESAVESRLRDAIAAKPDDLRAASRLAGFLGRRGKGEEARAVLERALAAEGATDTPVGRETRRRLATLLVSSGRQGDLEAALRLLEGGPVDDGRESAADAALAASILAARPDPASWRGTVARLDALEKRRALSVDESMLRARTRGRLGGPHRAAAREELARIADAPEAGPAVLAMLVELALGESDAVDAERWLDRLRRVAPGAPGTALLEIRAARARGDEESASRAVERILPLDGPAERDAASLLAAAALLENAGYPDRAEPMYREAAARSDEGRIRWAIALGRNRRTVEATTEIESLGERVSARTRLDALLAVVAAADEKGLDEVLPRVDALRERIVRENPGSADIELAAAILADVSGHVDGAVAAYRALIAGGTLPPRQFGVAAGNLAFDLAAPETADEAGALVERAIGELGPIPDLLDTRAMVRLAQGDTDAALADMADAILVPTAGRYLHLAAIHAAVGDLPAAREAFEKATAAGLGRERLSPADRERRRRVEAALAGGA